MDPPTGTLSSWHQRILAGLSFTTTKTKGKTVVKVTDAGAPVTGVTVKVKGDGSKKTGAGGTVSFDLPAGRYTVSAAKAGYASYSKRVREVVAACSRSRDGSDRISRCSSTFPGSDAKENLAPVRLAIPPREGEIRWCSRASTSWS